MDKAGLDIAAASMDRRRVLQVIATLLGAAPFSAPALATLAPKGTDDPHYFDAGRRAVLDRVLDLILPRTDTPGALDAGVPRLFDTLVQRWASPARQAQFTALLDEIAGLPTADGGGKFPALDPGAQFELLQRFDRASAARPDYRRFKELALSLYYLSETGATRELRYQLVPGAWEPAVKLTPGSRTWAA